MFLFSQTKVIMMMADLLRNKEEMAIAHKHAHADLWLW